MTDKNQKRIDYILSRCVEEGDCLMWTGHVSKDRLPIITENRAKKSARRKLYEAIKGAELPKNKIVRMKCGNHLCMNPDHLQVLTIAQARKADGKAGRYSTPIMQITRTRSSRARGKLTLEQAREIRASSLSLRKLSEIYGVDKSNIAHIKNGKAWADHENPFIGMFSQLVAANDSGRKRA